MIQAFLAASGADNKRQAKRERKRLKAEAKRERRHQNFLMQGFQSVTACIVAAITKEEVKVNDADHCKSSSGSSGSSGSGSDEEEESRKRKAKKSVSNKN